MKKIEYDIYDDNISKYHFPIDLDDYDIIIKSPVITDQNEIVKEALMKKKKMISDIELFYLKYPWKTFITVTGTNGKTTTVNLIAKIIGTVDLGGNVGKPIFDFMNSYRDIVIEASSFMLEYIEHYHSKINVILNLSPNHLDHHHTFANYIRSKFNLLKNLNKDDYLIYNEDDELLRRLVQHLDCNIIPFSITKEVKGGYIKGSNVFFNDELILSVDDIHLMGKHNIANIIASVCAALCYDKNIKGIESVVKDFQPIEHRIEYVGQINGIKVYNDSKSTNYKAMKIALDSFTDEKILLICGGKIREDNFDILNDSLRNIKKVLINGENRVVLADYFTRQGKSVETYSSLESCLADINRHCTNITTVLFSPGASSYDQFKNYEERGRYFKNQIIYHKLC